MFAYLPAPLQGQYIWNLQRVYQLRHSFVPSVVSVRAEGYQELLLVTMLRLLGQRQRKLRSYYASLGLKSTLY